MQETPTAETAGEGLWDAAIRLFEDKLGCVEHELALHLGIIGQEDPATNLAGRTESIHDLRVAARRAKAALDAFRPCVATLPGYRSLRRRMKSIREAVGRARDWDIFQERTQDFQKNTGEGQEQGVLFLQGYAVGQRLAAHEDGNDLSQKDLRRLRRQGRRFLRSLRRQARKNDDQPLTDFGHKVIEEHRAALEAAVSRYQAALRQGSRQVGERLHTARIATKHLRYAAELFDESLPHDDKQTFHADIEDLQKILGDAQDSRVTMAKAASLMDFTRVHAETAPRAIHESIASFQASQEGIFSARQKEFAGAWGQWRQKYGQGMTLH